MMDEQYAKMQKGQKLPPRWRVIYALVFVAVACGFLILWSAQRGHFELSRVLGVCGFKQRFGLPCPGCGWTHAAQQFVSGHPLQAFVTQPAAAVFALTAVIIAVFSLLFAFVGVDFRLPERIFCSRIGKWLLIAALIIVSAGWITTLARTILENASG